MSRGPKHPNTSRPTSSASLAREPAPVPVQVPANEAVSGDQSNAVPIASRSFFSVTFADGGEVGIRPSAVLWYQSTSADVTEVGMLGGKVLEIPLDVKRFASRLRNFK